MNALEILYICGAFVLLGFVMAVISLAICRIKATYRRKRKHFHSTVTYTPKLNLELQERTKSVDDSTALNDFKTG